jgi:hypothetical protein
MTPTPSFPAALLPQCVTILSYGALCSEPSARLTFPHLANFRPVRVHGYRRVFGQPHVFLLSRGLVEPSDLRIASLSVEPSEGSSFVAFAFEVALDDEQRAAFVAREREYSIEACPYFGLEDAPDATPAGVGVICLARTSDDALPPDIASLSRRWRHGVWCWPHDSGLKPADIYFRHCLLATQAAGGAAERSFLDDTFLCDRNTSVASYLDDEQTRAHVMASRPPADLAARFSG